MTHSQYLAMERLAGEVWDKLELEAREEIAKNFIVGKQNLELYSPLYHQWVGVGKKEKVRLTSELLNLKKGEPIIGL